MHLADAERDVKRGGEQRSARDERVVLAVLTTGVYTKRLELAHRLDRDAAADPALVEMRGARRHDDGRTAAADEFLYQRARRFTPQRKNGRESMRCADALVPRAMRVAHDVAEDDVRHPERHCCTEHPHVLVGISGPGAAAADARHAEPLGLRRNNVRPQAVRAAALAA